MPQFRYRAVTHAGEIIVGEVEASSREEVVRRIEYLGHLPIEAEVALRVALVSSTDRRVMFEVAFTYRDQVIGHGRHERAIVSIEKLKKRLSGGA